MPSVQIEYGNAKRIFVTETLFVPIPISGPMGFHIFMGALAKAIFMPS
jgi:hypothetical protein